MNTFFKMGVVLIGILSFGSNASAVCCEEPIEREEIAWEHMDEVERQGECECCYGEFCRQGTLITFWEPYRIIETVKDANCMMTAGEDQSEGDGEHTVETEDGETISIDKYGTHSDTGAQEDHSVFTQMHIVLPDYIRESIQENDQKCWHFSMGNSMDYTTESDSAWNDDTVAASTYPLTSIGAKYRNMKRCELDSYMSQLGFPIDIFFWCMGAWGMTFPMSGHVNNDEYVTGNISAAARGIYIGGRWGYIFEAASYYCYAGPMPLWIKSYFKFQPVRPINEEILIPIGQSSMVWDLGLNDVADLENKECVDNFAWVLWRKRWCCDSEGGGSGGGSSGGSARTEGVVQ